MESPAQSFHENILFRFYIYFVFPYLRAVIAQLGERKTEDLEVPGSIPGHGILPQDRNVFCYRPTKP